MTLSKENVLEFSMDTGIRVGQRKYQTLQKDIPNVRELSPLNVCLLRRNFYLYARLQKFRKAESNQYLTLRKVANIRENCANKYTKAREP